MKKIRKLIVTIVLFVLGPFAFVDNVQAANQFGYPEAKYNASMERFE